MTDTTVPLPATPPRVGVNYVPSRLWWYSWSEWDDAAITEDLQAIAGLGCDHVRIQCLWTVFQPNPAYVSAVALDRLERLLDLAHAASLGVVVTVLDGWLSGFDFRPEWLRGAGIFTDPAALAAERLLLREVGRRCHGHPAFLGLDVGNEPNVLAHRPENAVSRADGDAWIRMMTDEASRAAPGALVCVGVDHGPWIDADSPFGREELTSTGTVTPVHAWPFFTGAIARYGEGARAIAQLPSYMLELAKAHAEVADRPVWLQEVGASHVWQSDPEGFVSDVFATTLDVENLWGLTWWCSHDIDRALTGFDELEYDLGLLTADNRVKPMGERFRQAVDRIRAEWWPPVPRHQALILPEGTTPDLAFADRYFALCDSGERPAIVLESRARDAAYLAMRGITTLL